MKEETILITGGTGSFGQAFTKRLLNQHPDKENIIIFNRHEDDHVTMKQQWPKLRYVIGDVRDLSCLLLAFRGVAWVVHAAALKHVGVGEEQPDETVKTNIGGTVNVIRAAIDCGVDKVLAISSDKAVSPSNLYGATKLVSDKLFIGAEKYRATRFSVIRFGNFWDSRGSVAKIFQKFKDGGVGYLPIRDKRMTRYHITLYQAADIAINVLRTCEGGEIYAPKMASYRLTDLARAIYPDATLQEVGRTEGEKLHEDLITSEMASMTREFGRWYVTYPRWHPGLDEGKPVPENFCLSSDKNTQWVKEF